MQIARRSAGGGATVIALDGELDLATAPEVREAVLGAVGTNGAGVAIDMSACTFIDSTGLRILVEAGRKMQEDGRKLALIGLRDQPLKILELALGGHWELFEVAERAG